MADIGSHYPVPLDQVKETKEMRLLWLRSEIAQCDSKLAALERQRLHIQQEKDIRIKAEVDLRNSIEI